LKGALWSRLFFGNEKQNMGLSNPRRIFVPISWFSSISACLFVLILLAGCSSAPVYDEDGRAPASVKVEKVAARAPDSPEEIERILKETNPVLSESSGGEVEKVPLHIPIEINRKVAHWIHFFTVRERELTARYLERGEALRPHIEAILRENEVPQELYYLAMIESGFVSHAKSPAKAVGVWQFMKGTAKNYGMTVSPEVDERRQWIKSTEAAANYLKDLNNVFGSWYLALAAYNAGEHRIVRSIMRGKTRDFWALAEAGLLPKETLNYVPKFLAAHIVGRNQKRFGFEITVDPENRWGDFEVVLVPARVKLSELSRVSGVPLETLKRWNFDLIKGVTPNPRSGGQVEIYIPKEELSKFEANKDAILALGGKKRESESKRVSVSERRTDRTANDFTHSFYVVRRGDNLSGIAKRLGVSVRTLMKINGIRRGKVHPGQRLKYYGPQQSVKNNDEEKDGERSVATSEEQRKKEKRKSGKKQ
jgi:membrane-bound lytic murein transglycosylase D